MSFMYESCFYELVQMAILRPQSDRGKLLPVSTTKVLFFPPNPFLTETSKYHVIMLRMLTRRYANVDMIICRYYAHKKRIKTREKKDCWEINK